MKALLAIGALLITGCIVAQAPRQTRDQVFNSGPDVWGEAALHAAGGPSYAFFAKLLPPLRYVDANFLVYPITLSAPQHPVKARLVGNGSAVNALARQPNYISEAGRPLTFYVGNQRE